MHTCALMCKIVHVTYVHGYMHTYTCTHIHVHICMQCIHEYKHAHTHNHVLLHIHIHACMHAHAQAQTRYTEPTLSNCRFIICTFLYLHSSSYETLTTFLSQSTAPLSCQECFLHMKKPCSNKKPCELETPLSMCLKYGHGWAVSWQLSFHFVAKGVGWNWSLSKVSLTGKTAV